MEHEQFVPEIDLAVKLPQSPPGGDSQPAPSETIREACTRHGLDDDARQRIEQVLQGSGTTVATDELIAMLALALRHDDDVSNAQATGYIKGRNENIDEALARPHSDPTPEPPTFPRYVRRSIWD